MPAVKEVATRQLPVEPTSVAPAAHEYPRSVAQAPFGGREKRPGSCDSDDVTPPVVPPVAAVKIAAANEGSVNVVVGKLSEKSGPGTADPASRPAKSSTYTAPHTPAVFETSTRDTSTSVGDDCHSGDAVGDGDLVAEEGVAALELVDVALPVPDDVEETVEVDEALAVDEGVDDDVGDLTKGASAMPRNSEPGAGVASGTPAFTKVFDATARPYSAMGDAMKMRVLSKLYVDCSTCLGVPPAAGGVGVATFHAVPTGVEARKKPMPLTSEQYHVLAKLPAASGSSACKSFIVTGEDVVKSVNVAANAVAV